MKLETTINENGFKLCAEYRMNSTALLAIGAGIYLYSMSSTDDTKTPSTEPAQPSTVPIIPDTTTAPPPPSSQNTTPMIPAAKEAQIERANDAIAIAAAAANFKAIKFF